MDFQPFRYMAWAKAHQALGRYPLHQSGMPPATLEDLGVDRADLRIHPGVPTVFVRLREAVAKRYGVAPENVLPTCGTHHANFLAARALLRPGDGVLVESPWYEAIPGVMGLLGARVSYFRRRREEEWRLPLAELRSGLAAGAKMVALTDLHNPSGAAVRAEEWAALEAMAREFGATVLVDEVFRDFLPAPVGTCFRPGAPFVATSSLTKVYSLGHLRIGWVIGAPDVVETARQVNEFVVVNLPVVAAEVALAAWDRLPAQAERARELAHRNSRVLAAWIRGRNDVLWSPPDAGISSFLELRALDGQDDVAWCRRVLDETGVGLVPGSMFDAPGYVRLSFGCSTEELQAALALLGPALDSR
jgi:aspartate/methionine/tyrosine aminotransferase